VETGSVAVEHVGGVCRHDELLDQELFQSLAEARVMLEQWRRWFNEERPHGALGDKTPIDVLIQYQASGSLTMEPTP